MFCGVILIIRPNEMLSSDTICVVKEIMYNVV